MSKENYLRKVIEVQEIVLKYKAKFVPQKRIYDEYIKNQYFISYSTFNQYLTIPAKSQLRELLAGKENQVETSNNT